MDELTVYGSLVDSRNWDAKYGKEMEKKSVCCRGSTAELYVRHQSLLSCYHLSMTIPHVPARKYYVEKLSVTIHSVTGRHKNG